MCHILYHHCERIHLSPPLPTVENHSQKFNQLFKKLNAGARVLLSIRWNAVGVVFHVTGNLYLFLCALPIRVLCLLVFWFGGVLLFF